MNNKRPSPEELLARIKEEERQHATGKLKIFFGAAPGVGKTHAMLEEALEKLSEGIDIVAGIVESHGRKEIESLLAKIEQLPRRDISYHGRTLQEFDLEKALERKPAVILVDELAHTNLPGLKHTKRWQDVKELLNNGINVYTTLNVQHVESINDIVAQVTGVTVRETVPDIIVEEASSIELIDLPPDDLLKRLQKGKVYAPEQAELATKKFFIKGNLIALRELALRMAAEHVNAQVLSYRENKAIQKTWPTTEKVLVYITPSVDSAKLIRVARRMAVRLQAKWMAVYVAPAHAHKLSDLEQHHLDSNFNLAESLGGETFTIQGKNIVETLINFARDSNVTKILVGKELLRSRLKTFLFGSLPDEIIRHSGDMDVYVIRGGFEKTFRLLPILDFKPIGSWVEYLYGFFIVILVSVLGIFFKKIFSPSNVSLLYVLGVIIISMRGRRGPAIMTVLLSALAYGIFFPLYTSTFPNTENAISFIVMFVLAFFASYAVIFNVHQRELARLRERRNIALYALTRKLTSCRGVNKVLQIATQHVAEVFDSRVTVLLPDEKYKLAVKATYGDKEILDEKERGVAQWVFDQGQPAGLGTHSLPYAKALYIPLLGSRAVVGVLRIHPVVDRLIAPEQLHLLETFAGQIALAIEADQKISE
jgi:two-component system, OmpR family, sensor histidine kinase KdpD